MKKNKGITMIALVITIILLLILAGISVGAGNNLVKESQLENLKTNMLLIKVKGKEFVENANFKLGTKIEDANEEDKNSRIQNAKAELHGEEITDINTYLNIETSGDTEYLYYYKLSTQDLIDIGITNVESDSKNGWYIVKYDVKNMQTEVYNTKGFTNEDKTYYSLNEIQDLNV